MKNSVGYLSIFIVCILALSACNPFQKHTPLPKEKQEAGSQNDANEVEDPNQPSTPDTELSPKQIFDLAQTGKVNNCEFAAHTNNIADVEKKWGAATSTDEVENDFYANYPSKNTVFGYHENQIIFDVRSYDKRLNNITFPQLLKELGDPTYTRQYLDDQIYGYKVNNQYELRFIIPKKTGKVDHISVYSTSDKNSASAPPPYILAVKGTSKNLSTSAWESMQAWRSDMITVVRNHPNSVFLNGPKRKAIALTFDDGPDLQNTPKIIDILSKYKVKGNFFFIGERVKKFPEVVKSAYDNGNIILSHSYYHNDLSKMTAFDIKADLDLTEKALFDVIGIIPTLLRPPYGAVNETVISTATNNGYKIVLWSIDTLDWSQKASNNIENNVLNNVRDGDIILMHTDEDKNETVKALPHIIEGLIQKGFEIVDLQTLLNKKAYK
jgi:peptidoglycan-N-acetylglucosamine deacetylase